MHISWSDLWTFLLSRKVISTQILFYFILEDFVFYWGHRVLHTKWLYKHVHSIHHEWVKSIKFLYRLHSFWCIHFCLPCLVFIKGILLNLQVCNTIWTDIWICSPCWDPVSWICNNCWSCHHRPPSYNSLAVDGSSSSWDSWGSLRLSFPLEPLKLLAFVRRVSICIFLLIVLSETYKSLSLMCSALCTVLI